MITLFRKRDLVALLIFALWLMYCLWFVYSSSWRSVIVAISGHFLYFTRKKSIIIPIKLFSINLYRVLIYEMYIGRSKLILLMYYLFVPGNNYLYRAILISVTSECRLMMVSNNAWTGSLANSADPDQTPHNEASDQGLNCLLKFQEVKG